MKPKNLLTIVCLSLTLTNIRLLAQDFDATSSTYSNGATYLNGRSWVSDFMESGGSIEEITGAVKPDDKEDLNFVELTEMTDLPQHFDLREQTPLGLPPVKNQGSCGSCWAFSVVGVVESLLSLKFTDSDHNDLAEQTLVSQCFGRGSCSGGWFDALDYAKRKGLPDESENRYSGYYQYCKQTKGPLKKILNWSYIKNKGASPTIQQIKTALYEFGPVAATVYANFTSYSRGVFNQCYPGGENHMVVIVGWDDADNSWFVRNSWGENWGEEGYFRIKRTDSYGRKCSNIGATAAFAELGEE